MDINDLYKGLTDSEGLRKEIRLREQGKRIAEIFELKKDVVHEDRYRITWGTKSDLGIVAVILRLADEIIKDETIKIS